MSNFDENIEKGIVLMKDALTKYEDGEYQAAEASRKDANHFFQLAKEESEREDFEDEQLYGESRNFGVMYHVFEKGINNLIKTDEGKKIIKEGFDLIKNNEILSEQFKVYDLFEKTSDITNTLDFVSESLTMLKPLKKEVIIENNNKFINFLHRNNFNEYILINEDTEKLYEAIEQVLLCNKKIGSLKTLVQAKRVIAEHLSKNTTNQINEGTESYNNFKEMLDKANDNLHKTATKEEKELISIFTDGDEETKRSKFTEVKDEVLKKLQKEINSSNDEEKAALQDIYNKLEKEEYSNNIEEDIKKCAEMIEVSETIDE